MLILASVLNILAALGLAAMAAKYLFGPAPADYHAEVLKKAGIEFDQTLALLFGAINKVYGAAFMALAMAIVCLTVFGVMNDLLWAKALILLCGLIAGVPAALAAKRVEERTGVRTPWRIALVLTAVVSLGFLVSVA